MSLLPFRFSWKISSLEGKNLYFCLQLLTTDCIKCTLFINQLVSKPIQPAVGVKDSVPNKAVGMKDLQTARSGKFCSANFTLERGTLKYLKHSQPSYS